MSNFAALREHATKEQIAKVVKQIMEDKKKPGMFSTIIYIYIYIYIFNNTLEIFLLTTFYFIG